MNGKLHLLFLLTICCCLIRQDCSFAIFCAAKYLKCSLPGPMQCFSIPAAQNNIKLHSYIELVKVANLVLYELSLPSSFSAFSLPLFLPHLLMLLFLEGLL